MPRLIDRNRLTTVLPIFGGIYIAGIILLAIEMRKVQPRRDTSRIYTGLGLCIGGIVFAIIIVLVLWAASMHGEL